jgi:hypothetical protein
VRQSATADRATPPVSGFIFRQKSGPRLWRRLALPKRVDAWSLTSLQQRLMRTGGRLVKRVRYYWLLLAEGRLTGRLFGAIVQRLASAARGRGIADRDRCGQRGR